MLLYGCCALPPFLEAPVDEGKPPLDVVLHSCYCLTNHLDIECPLRAILIKVSDIYLVSTSPFMARKVGLGRARVSLLSICFLPCLRSNSASRVCPCSVAYSSLLTQRPPRRARADGRFSAQRAEGEGRENRDYPSELGILLTGGGFEDCCFSLQPRPTEPGTRNIGWFTEGEGNEGSYFLLITNRTVLQFYLTFYRMGRDSMF